jgi:hypothetical protein
MTDNNDHGGAIMHGARLLGRKDLHDKAKDIRAAHLKAGHLTSELSEKRNVVGNELDAHAKATLSPEHHAAFHGAF